MARKWWTLIAVCTGIFMLLLDITIVNVALPDIESTFGASLSDLQWVIDAYALTLAAFLLTAGTIADRAGRRKVFATGIVIFTLGSLLCGVAQGSLFLTLARAAQGVGGAVMFATSLALLAQTFHGKDRGVAFGVFGAITGVAIALGPVIGGALTSGLSWRWIFFVNLPIGIAALVITLSRVDESRAPRRRRPDWAGFATFSLGLTALVFGLIRSGPDGWSSPLVIGSLTAAGVLLAAFTVIELLEKDPMFDLGLARVPAFNGGLVAALGISASVFSVITYITLYFQDVLGFSAIGTGIRFLPLSGAVFVAAGIAGRLTSKVPLRVLIGLGFALCAVGLFLMRGITPDSSWTHLLPGMIVAGVGAGLINVPLAATAVGVVEPARAGMGSGINSTFRQIGIATGIAVLGTIFVSQLRAVVVDDLTGTALAARAQEIAAGVSNGHAAGALAALPPELRGAATEAARSGFVDGLNLILLISVVVCGVAAVLSFALIRQRDLVSVEGDAEVPAKGGALTQTEGRAAPTAHGGPTPEREGRAAAGEDGATAIDAERARPAGCPPGACCDCPAI